MSLPRQRTLDDFVKGEAKRRKPDLSSSSSTTSSATLALEDVDGLGTHEPRLFDRNSCPDSHDPEQGVLSFVPMIKKRKRTMTEIYQLIPEDHRIWTEGWTCMKGCDCWFCEIYLGEIIVVKDPHETSSSDPLAESDSQ